MRAWLTKRNEIFDLLILVVVWCLSIAVVNPIGNFPLNDDWAWGLTVKRFLATGDFVPHGWASMTLLTNVLWGALFCTPAGFSFDALRFSTLTLSLAGIVGCYFLMKDLRLPRMPAVIAALTLGFNPIYYALSHTFMTDVPYTAITIFAALFLVRHLRTASNLDMFAGIILIVAATLSRQIAISLPMAFAVTLFLKRGFTSRNLLRAIAPFAFSLVAYLVFQQWLARSGHLPENFDAQTAKLFHMLANPGILIKPLVHNTSVALLYLGLFLMPVLTFAVTGLLQSHTKKTLTLLLASGCMLAMMYWKYASYFGHALIMPLSGNIMVASGIGPVLLRDASILGLNQPPVLTAGLWMGITAISLLGATFLSTVTIIGVMSIVPRLRPGRMNDNEAACTFLLLGALIYLSPFLIEGFYDRYLISVIPFLTASLAGFASQISGYPRSGKMFARVAATALIIASCVFAVFGTRDYLSWNRVRWEALHDLMGSKTAKPEEIDGGFEFNGLYMYNPKRMNTHEKSWWWVQGDTYQIGFGAVPGYSVLREYGYYNCLPPHSSKMVVLKKNVR
jgi:hypothetical protein